MEIYRVIAIAVVACVIILQLRNERPELALVVSVAASLVILSILIGGVREVVLSFSELVEKSGMDHQTFRLLLKMVGIGYLTEVASDTVEDFGSKSLSGKISIAGKLSVFLLALPIFKQLITVISELV